ncbi:MAG: hypothetical protein ACPLRJ_03450 [Infirmifilum uzonense]|uniref:hypothetical protein n=2 Tax=Infirmifilum uzonense TaxID=1550241 RepID=UPI003C75B4A4
MFARKLTLTLLVIITVSVFSLAEPTVRLAWKTYSVRGVAYSTCIGQNYLYIVGFEEKGSQQVTRIEARRLNDGALVINTTLGPGALYSCAFSRGTLYVAGKTESEEWLIATLNENLAQPRIVKSVKGFASSIVVSDGFLYVTGVDYNKASVRVEKRSIESFSLIGAYEALAPNTYAFASTIVNDAVWLTGTAYTPTGFIWRIQALAPNLTSILTLRPQVEGISYSITASREGLMYVTGPNGTISLDPQGIIVSKSTLGGFRVAELSGVLVILSGKDTTKALVLNASDLTIISSIELSKNPVVPSFGSTATSSDKVFLASAEKIGNSSTWSIYALSILVPSRITNSTQSNTQTKPAQNSTSTTNPTVSIQPTPILDYITPLLMILVLVLGVVMVRRKRKHRAQRA